jgi:hypothetical protein
MNFSLYLFLVGIQGGSNIQPQETHVMACHPACRWVEIYKMGSSQKPEGLMMNPIMI